MLKGATKEKIDEVVQAFSESSKHKSHGRPIWASEVDALGLKVTIMKPKSPLWEASYELLQRFDHLCMLRRISDGEEITKVLETVITSHRSAVSLAEEG